MAVPTFVAAETIAPVLRSSTAVLSLSIIHI